MSRYDAIISLGGGSQRGEDCTTLPPWVLRRLDLAAELYWRQVNGEAKTDAVDAKGTSFGGAPKIVVLSAGTPHRPNYVNKNGWPVLEATSEAYYLIREKKIPPEDVYREATSLDTIGNAYFFRMQHLEPNRGRWKRIAVITSAFHMPRTEAVFRWMFSIPFSLPTSGEGEIIGPPQIRALDFLSVSDEGLDADGAISSRAAREAESLQKFEKMQQERFPVATTSLAVVHQWLFTEHTAYSTHDNMTPNVDIASLSPEVLATY